MKFTNLNPLAQRNGRNRKKEEWIWSGGSARVGSDSAGAQALNLGEGNLVSGVPHDPKAQSPARRLSAGVRPKAIRQTLRRGLAPLDPRCGRKPG